MVDFISVNAMTTHPVAWPTLVSFVTFTCLSHPTANLLARSASSAFQTNPVLDHFPFLVPASCLPLPFLPSVYSIHNQREPVKRFSQILTLLCSASQVAFHLAQSKSQNISLAFHAVLLG